MTLGLSEPGVVPCEEDPTEFTTPLFAMYKNTLSVVAIVFLVFFILFH